MLTNLRITGTEGLGDELSRDVSRDSNGLARDQAVTDSEPKHILTAAQQEASSEHTLPRPHRPAPALPTAYQTDYTSRVHRASSNRVASPTGGVQVTLDGGGSWSDLARQDATLPTDANAADGGKSEGSGGMFGFLKGKKGRNHSPRPKERGVLGKEGARVVIG